MTREASSLRANLAAELAGVVAHVAPAVVRGYLGIRMPLVVLPQPAQSPGFNARTRITHNAGRDQQPGGESRFVAGRYAFKSESSTFTRILPTRVIQAMS